MTTSIMNSSESIIACIPQTNLNLLAFTLIPLSQISINLIVITAVLSNRNRLRHNFVYVYVINTSMANVLFGTFSLYDIVNFAVAFERNWGAPNPFSKIDMQPLLSWWSFRTGMLVCLFIAMNGSISALIYGIRESSYFVGRTVRHVVKEPSRTNQRMKMLGIISFNWFVPIVLCIASAAGWNCVQKCECTPAYYGPDVFQCKTDVIKMCSNAILPQTKSFMLVTVILWFVECIGIVFMIATTMKKYLDIMSTKSHRNDSTMSSVYVSEQEVRSPRGKSDTIPSFPSETSNNNRNKTHNNSSSHHVENDIIYDDDVTSKKIPGQENKVFKDEKSGPSCIEMPPLNHNIKLLLIISVLFILCTSPAMFVVLIDVISKEYQLSFYGIMVPFVICLLYGSIAPILLVYYMSGLRTAVLHMLFRCSCCQRTTLSSTSSSLTS